MYGHLVWKTGSRFQIEHRSLARSRGKPRLCAVLSGTWQSLPDECAAQGAADLPPTSPMPKEEVEGFTEHEFHDMASSTGEHTASISSRHWEMPAAAPCSPIRLST